MKQFAIPTLVSALFSLLLSATPAAAHCQVPCGIYADDNVIAGMHTDWTTIEKATKQIAALTKPAPRGGAAPSSNPHQLTRWIINKEQHAQNIQDTVSAYFLAQRVKVPADDASEADKTAYIAKVTLCHKVIVAAMKCKQSADPAAVETLHNLLHDFEKTFGS